jgi:hydroxyacylglutathione hydrolase
VSGPDVRMFTVGPVQENAYIVRADPRAPRALLIDPGEEAPRLLEAVAALGVQVEAILITHCHFDHIGAVAPTARALGAPVYCPQIEAPLLRDINAWTPPGFGPFENWEPQHTLAGGERLALAGLEIEVLFTPGHSPGHLTYAIAPAAGAPQAAGEGEGLAALAGGQDGVAQPGPAQVPVEGERPPAALSDDGSVALLSGDVLFQGSVGRTDLPGGDWAVLERSIGALVERFAPQTVVHPGHMGVTTLGRELQSNPFLDALRTKVA